MVLLQMPAQVGKGLAAAWRDAHTLVNRVGLGVDKVGAVVVRAWLGKTSEKDEAEGRNSTRTKRGERERHGGRVCFREGSEKWI